jgi:hypothetical protein
MTQISVLGIDIAKQIFHVVGMDDTGRGATVCGQPSADRCVWPAATREGSYRRCHIWTRLQRQGALESSTNRNRCGHISGLMVKASARLRALMKCALLLLINLSAFAAFDNVRVWRSRSDRSCHQLRSTLGIVEECLGSLPMLSKFIRQSWRDTLGCAPGVPRQPGRFYWPTRRPPGSCRVGR